MFSSGGPSVRFLTRYDGEVSEPLVWPKGLTPGPEGSEFFLAVPSEVWNPRHRLPGSVTAEQNLSGLGFRPTVRESAFWGDPQGTGTHGRIEETLSKVVGDPRAR